MHTGVERIVLDLAEGGDDTGVAGGDTREAGHHKDGDDDYAEDDAESAPRAAGFRRTGFAQGTSYGEHCHMISPLYCYSVFISRHTVSTVLPLSHKTFLTSLPSRYIGKLNSIDFNGISDSPFGYI